MTGAAFIKFGRAPTTCVICIPVTPLIQKYRLTRSQTALSRECSLSRANNFLKSDGNPSITGQVRNDGKPFCMMSFVLPQARRPFDPFVPMTDPQGTEVLQLRSHSSSKNFQAFFAETFMPIGRIEHRSN